VPTRLIVRKSWAGQTHPVVRPLVKDSILAVWSRRPVEKRRVDGDQPRTDASRVRELLIVGRGAGQRDAHAVDGEIRQETSPSPASSC